MQSYDTAIIEFEVIFPANCIEKVGEKLKLSLFGEFCPDKSLRGYSLLFLLDNPMHYRVSKVKMKGRVFSIPSDRKKNYATDLAF